MWKHCSSISGHLRVSLTLKESEVNCFVIAVLVYPNQAFIALQYEFNSKFTKDRFFVTCVNEQFFDFYVLYIQIYQILII